MSLEGLGKNFIQFLSPYLGPYGCMLAMTCKYMKANVIVKKYPFITQFYEQDGHLGLLQWCFRHEWYILENTPNVPLSVLKWKYGKALHDPVEAFENACKTGDLEVIEHCIRKKYIKHWEFNKHYSIEAIEYLYHCKDITLKGSLWKHNDFNYSEDFYEWAYQYHSDERIGFPDFVFAENLSAIIRVWICRGFKNTQMMRNYLLMNTEPQDILSIEVCNQLTYPVAKAIHADECECGDPTNHEKRKRIKF